MRVPRCLSLSILLLALTALSFAQATATGSFVGRVTDQTSKEVAGAKVTATNVATHYSSSVETTAAGYYAIAGLRPGMYEVSVEASGFGTTKTQAALNVGDSQDINFTLHPRAADVEPELSTQLLQPTRTDVSTVVDGLDLRLLPVFASAQGGISDFAQLALITPGMKLDTSGDSSRFGASGTDLIGPGSVNFRYNQYNITGANVTDQVFSGRDGVGASVEEVQQFQVLAANADAQYSPAGGFLLNAVTKSGSNSYHGDGHVYFRGRNLQASNPFYNLALAAAAIPIDGARRAPFHRQEGGFNIGGPLIKDRLFWFANFEISHQGMPVIPLPGVTLNQPTNDVLFSGRLDFKISEHNTFFTRFIVERFYQDNLFFPAGTNVIPDNLATWTRSQHEVGLSTGLTSTLTSHLLNQAGFSFFQTSNELSLRSTPAPVSIASPQDGLQKRFQLFDNLTWTRGRHTLKVGLDINVDPWSNHHQPFLNQPFYFGQYGDFINLTPRTFTFTIGPARASSQDTLAGIFVQDYWRLTSKLTLNVGLRYDLQTGAFPSRTSTCSNNPTLNPAWCHSQHNLQPRAGLAWAPWQHTVVRASYARNMLVAPDDLALNTRLFDGVNTQTVTVTGTTPAGLAVLAAFPNVPGVALLAPFVPPAGSFGDVRTINRLGNPVVDSVNVALEHQFGNSFTVTVQYLGQFGSDLFGERDLNPPAIVADPAHPGFFYYRGRPDPAFGTIQAVENNRSSSYNGLLVSVNKRFSRHVQFLANYTWSHNLTSADDFFSSEPGDPRNVRAEMGPALDDVRHAANFGVILDSGKMTEHRVTGWFVNDVTLALLGQLQSGRPYNLSTGTAGLLGERFSDFGNGSQQRPNVLPDGTISAFAIPSAIGSTAMFGPGGVATCIAGGFPAAQCNALQNTFIAPGDASGLGPLDSLSGDIVDFQLPSGNLGRNAARSASFYRLDASLQKSFRLPTTEDVRLEFRVDAFNLFNRSNFQGPQFNSALTALRLSLTPVGTPAPDFFTCTACLRPNGQYVGTTGQALKLQDLQNGRVSPNLLSPTFGGVGDPSSADIPRTLQLSLRVRF